jgi:hypothetical protein
MSRSYRRLLAAALLIAGAPGAFAQAASCNITLTWPTWVGGNGFGASIDIRNTGAAITNGWTLVFNFPNGQQLQNGWPVNVTQSGTTVTAASNADWNKAIPTNGTFNVAFNGTFSGTNNPPTAFTLNGTACSIGGTNPAPTGVTDEPDGEPELRGRRRRYHSPPRPVTRTARSPSCVPRRRRRGEHRYHLALQFQRHRSRDRHTHRDRDGHRQRRGEHHLRHGDVHRGRWRQSRADG